MDVDGGFVPDSRTWSVSLYLLIAFLSALNMLA